MNTEKIMKTAEQVLQASYIMNRGFENDGYIVEAMRAYAAQFIEKAADVAQVRTDYLPASDTLSYFVDRGTILKLKSELL